MIAAGILEERLHLESSTVVVFNFVCSYKHLSGKRPSGSVTVANS